MISYTLCAIAFFAGLGGLIFFAKVLTDRAVHWNYRRRDRALRYRARRHP